MAAGDFGIAPATEARFFSCFAAGGGDLCELAKMISSITIRIKRRQCVPLKIRTKVAKAVACGAMIQRHVLLQTRVTTI